MTIYKRGNVWWASWMRDGVRHRVSVGRMPKTQAQKMATAMQTATKAPGFEKAVEILRLFYADENNATPLDGAWDRYLEMLKTIGRDDVADATMKHRRQYYARFMKWIGAARPSVKFIEAVDAGVAAAFAAHLGECKSQFGKPLSKSSRRDIIAELRGVWAVLKRVNPQIVNPWEGLAPTKTAADAVPKRMFTPDEERRVMAAAEKIGKGWPLACLIARHTGLRYGSVARLEWREVDLKRGILHHEPYKTRKHGIVVDIPLVKVLWTALKKARKAVGKDETHILPNHAALYTMDNRYREKHLGFREVLDAADIHGVEYTFHSWRKTAASSLAEAGASVELRKKLMGHTTDAMAEHYDQSQRIDEKRAALERAAARK